MNEPRKVGLALIFLGVVVLLGNTTEALPPEAFFAGLFLYPIGGYLFFKGSRQAIQEAEVRAARIRAPRLKNETAERYAEKQKSNIAANGSVDSQMVGVAGSAATSAATSAQPTQPVKDDLTNQLRQEAAPTPTPTPQNVVADTSTDVGKATDENFNVTSDVSFPVEVQQHDSLAEQILKLQKLKEDGIISDDEMAIAKAKLLG